MKRLLFPLLTMLVLASAPIGMIGWMSEINPREPAVSWTIRIATAILFPTSLIGLVALAMKPETVPDFLGQLKQPRMGRGDIVFVFDCIARDGWACLEIYYQNRYSKAANVAVAVQPSQNFTMSRNKIDPVLVQFACGPAAYGIVHVPIAIQREYQGKSQQFDVAEQTDFPDGTGPILRNVVGPEMSKLNMNDFLRSVVALVKMAVTGHLASVKFQSRVQLNLPMRVAESGQPPPISQDEIWTLPAKVPADRPEKNSRTQIADS